MHACWLLPLARDRARGASVQSPAQVPFTRFTAGSKFAHEFALSLPDINSSTGGRMDVEDGNSTSTPGHAKRGRTESEGGRASQSHEGERLLHEATAARCACCSSIMYSRLTADRQATEWTEPTCICDRHARDGQSRWVLASGCAAPAGERS
eukprot:COSAG03_NODE_1041_length_4978_cov_7.787661_2_plen_152_part_00